jgi:hypothetical protein
MQLPHWFTNSLYDDKSILIESFVYFKPDGPSDIGTTVHSPTLIDGSFAQFDYMIGLSTTGINRQFSIASKPTEIEFYFKDYLSDERLMDTEDIEEIKTDDEGNYYTEYLGARDLKDGQVVNLQDILTDEDSMWNKLDFYDSDGKDKSLWGVAAKLVSQVAPYYIPVVGPGYAAFTTVMGLTSVLPAFYKSIEGLLLGD